MHKYSTRVKEIKREEYLQLKRGKLIKTSRHATWHIGLQERKVFNDEYLKQVIKRELPRKIYQQVNERYALYFRRKDHWMKVIIEITGDKINIITFMNIDELPR